MAQQLKQSRSVTAVLGEWLTCDGEADEHVEQAYLIIYINPYLIQKKRSDNTAYSKLLVFLV